MQTTLLRASFVRARPPLTPRVLALPLRPIYLAAELEAYVLSHPEPVPQSGKQEKYEQLINQYV